MLLQVQLQKCLEKSSEAHGASPPDEAVTLSQVRALSCIVQASIIISLLHLPVEEYAFCLAQLGDPAMAAWLAVHEQQGLWGVNVSGASFHHQSDAGALHGAYNSTSSVLEEPHLCTAPDASLGPTG